MSGCLAGVGLAHLHHDTDVCVMLLLLQTCAQELSTMAGLAPEHGGASEATAGKADKGKKGKKGKGKGGEEGEAGAGSGGGVGTSAAPLEEFLEWATSGGSAAGGPQWPTVVHSPSGVPLGQAPTCLHTLRCFAVQCLHKCFLHDGSAFMDRDRLQVVLKPLTSLFTLPVAAGPAPSHPDGGDARGAKKRKGGKKDEGGDHARGDKRRRLRDGDADGEEGADAVALHGDAAAGGAHVLSLVPIPVGTGAGGASDAYNLFVSTYAIPAVSQLAMTIADSTVWKPLNHAVLFLTRHTLARVRAAALRCLLAFASASGGEFLSLLPETLPYISERLEDDSREVEALCHALLRKLEDLSGESLQEYLKK
jgi:hypothetical protein